MDHVHREPCGNCITDDIIGVLATGMVRLSMACKPNSRSMITRVRMRRSRGTETPAGRPAGVLAEEQPALLRRSYTTLGIGYCAQSAYAVTEGALPSAKCTTSIATTVHVFVALRYDSITAAIWLAVLLPEMLAPPPTRVPDEQDAVAVAVLPTAALVLNAVGVPVTIVTLFRPPVAPVGPAGPIGPGMPGSPSMPAEPVAPTGP